MIVLKYIIEIFQEIKSKLLVQINLQDELTLKSRNKLQDISNKISTTDNILVGKQKRKKSKIVVTSVFSNNPMNSQNIETNELKNPNHIYSNKRLKDENIYNKNNKMRSQRKDNAAGSLISENRRIIERIKMKCYCVYLWFCFFKKKTILKIFY